MNEILISSISKMVGDKRPASILDINKLKELAHLNDDSLQNELDILEKNGYLVVKYANNKIKRIIINASFPN
ncbi:hypothetical protein EFN12_03875 [Pediococcus pentosaceus]|uniref:hypothetical protein n=1 Tax=Pediococcus pentosaceus TaxID=1255 RepID=UPI0021A37785|nr:hypothetical protein [Pediococcus pentosaceus]MCT3023760.1 hypothetical protein [Pediococcus pentosaceus]